MITVPGTIKAIARTAKTGSTCTADIGGITVTVEVARDLTVAVGDGILVVRSGATWYAFARFGVAAPAELPDSGPPPPAPKPPQRGKLVISPTDTHTYQSGPGWFHDDVRQGVYGGQANCTGCAFYGTKARSLSGATATRATIAVRRKAGGTYAAQTATLRQVTQSSRPAGAPTLTGSATGPSLKVDATNNAFVIPTSWAQDMIDGVSGGLGVFVSGGSPYIVFAGRADWSPAWTLTIEWSR